MTLREAINEAQVKGNDILITDGNTYLEESWTDADWQVAGEVDWFLNTNELDYLTVKKVVHDTDGITTIYTNEEIDV